MWSSLYNVLDELGRQCSGSSEGMHEASVGSMGESEETDEGRQCSEGASERLEAVCEVVLNWGKSLIGSDLESIQYILRRIEATSNMWPSLSGALLRLMASLQDEVKARYNGRILLHTHAILEA